MFLKLILFINVIIPHHLSAKTWRVRHIVQKTINYTELYFTAFERYRTCRNVFIFDCMDLEIVTVLKPRQIGFIQKITNLICQDRAESINCIKQFSLNKLLLMTWWLLFVCFCDELYLNLLFYCSNMSDTLNYNEQWELLSVCLCVYVFGCLVWLYCLLEFLA